MIHNWNHHNWNQDVIVLVHVHVVINIVPLSIIKDILILKFNKIDFLTVI